MIDICKLQVVFGFIQSTLYIYIYSLDKLIHPRGFIYHLCVTASKRCPSIGFLSRADTEIGVFRRVAPTTRLRLEFPRETGQEHRSVWGPSTAGHSASTQLQVTYPHARAHAHMHTPLAAQGTSCLLVGALLLHMVPINSSILPAPETHPQGTLP